MTGWTALALFLRGLAAGAEAGPHPAGRWAVNAGPSTGFLEVKAGVGCVRVLSVASDGPGGGRAAMALVTGLADATGLALELRAVPCAEGRLGAVDLEAWYGRLGFVPAARGPGPGVAMRREPRPGGLLVGDEAFRAARVRRHEGIRNA